MHTFINEKMYWRNGVVLKYENNLALIEANYQNKAISILIAGNDRKHKGLTETVNISQLLNGIEDGEIRQMENSRESIVFKPEIYITSTAESKMSDKAIFNQQGQTVQGNQQNIGRDANRTFENTGTIQGSNINLGDNSTQNLTVGGDVNFESVKNKDEFVNELKKLQEQLQKAIEQKAFDDDRADDIEYQIKKAVKQADKPQPEKKTLLEHLGSLKGLVGGVSTTLALATSLKEAIEKVPQIFG